MNATTVRLQAETEQQLEQVYKDKFVIFLDFLGFKALIEESEKKPEKVNKIKEMLSFFTEEKIISYFKARSPSEEHYEEFIKRCTNIEISNFSDCVVISFCDSSQNPTNNQEVFLYMIEAIGLISLKVAKEFNVLIRGGITRGNIFHDSKTLFGPALNRAYKLESKIANYPQILIDKSIMALPSEGALGYESVRTLITTPSSGNFEEYKEDKKKFYSFSIISAMNYIKESSPKMNGYVNSFVLKVGVDERQFHTIINPIKEKLFNLNERDLDKKEKAIQEKYEWVLQQLKDSKLV